MIQVQHCDSDKVYDDLQKAHRFPWPGQCLQNWAFVPQVVLLPSNAILKDWTKAARLFWQIKNEPQEQYNPQQGALILSAEVQIQLQINPNSTGWG